MPIPSNTILPFFPKYTLKRYRQIEHLLQAGKNAFWQIDFDEMKRSGWDDEIISEFLTWRETFDWEQKQREMEKEGITIITKNDDIYPPLLKEIYDPPLCLFVRGNLSSMNFPIAVVGTRAATSYGKQMTMELVESLARQGVTIVSGLALGIDSIAHQSALRVNGKTIAVLGSGVNDTHIYPREHYNLAKQIVDKGGAIMSEYPPGTEPTKYTFPQRNRIIAGMTLGTLVIEAAEKSGALITAQCALDSNREVFAIPHPITSRTSFGPHQLLKRGATFVTSADDILEALHLEEISTYVAAAAYVPASPTEAQIFDTLSKEPVHIDAIVKTTTLQSPVVMSTLTLMEMKGQVKNLGNMMYIRTQ